MHERTHFEDKYEIGVKGEAMCLIYVQMTFKKKVEIHRNRKCFCDHYLLQLSQSENK